MTNKRYILFNSIARCGNTFLYQAFVEAINRNFDGGSDRFFKEFTVISHVHNQLILKIPKEDKNVIQFTNFRDPIEQIPSLFGLSHYRKSLMLPDKLDKKKLNQSILKAISEYKDWTSLYLEGRNSNIVLFDDIKKDVNVVLKDIFNKLDLSFITYVDINSLKKTILHYDSMALNTEEEKFFMGKLPRGFNETPEYLEIQDILLNNKWINYNFKQLLSEYNQILEIKRDQSIS